MSRTEPEGPRRQGQSHSDLSKRWAHSEDRCRGGPAAVGKGKADISAFQPEDPGALLARCPLRGWAAPLRSYKLGPPLQDRTGNCGRPLAALHLVSVIRGHTLTTPCLGATIGRWRLDRL